MTDVFASLATGCCPYCGNDRFHRGPQGGLSVNVQCAYCEKAFNVTLWGGTVMFAEEIDTVPEFRRRDDAPQRLVVAASPIRRFDA